jgi:hypothetical protein
LQSPAIGTANIRVKHASMCTRPASTHLF